MSKLIIDYNQKKEPDFIGDIHGYYDELIQLFEKMGYANENGIYKHPDRFPVFIGDYIDRGPKIFETIALVKRMQETGNAIALMGNHELNYLELHYKNVDGNTFRSQSKRNQVAATDEAFAGKDKEVYLDWMSKLPIAIESGHFRAVHAQWEEEAIKILKESKIEKLDENGLRTAHDDSKLYKSIEVLLKGKELKLPETLHYNDHGSEPRTEARIKWWQPRKRTLFGEDFASLPVHMIDKDISDFGHDYVFYYDNTQKPVFFGHYWMDAKKVKLMSSNACCVDYSIAKEGILVAYRHSQREALSNDYFITHQ
ncbi:metallophosphoesterase [Flavobacterium aciduliphilum]|uniref:Calcineurin-like phosphoesterase family protein n=1 Tax=Flavobacterium aciduliphilum TaxID=1101402 RepID=A0A328YI94_9FLAO|nr:metallophosphoesterase [Flavobacterium aciduliphilum]RAR73761.1 calcineurin-like phosphoesterase family protein [Flavobacterium aciduliphilum]